MMTRARRVGWVWKGDFQRGGGGKHDVVTVPFTTGFDFKVFMSTCDDNIVYFCGQLVLFIISHIFVL